jgi:hypothetical protein
MTPSDTDLARELRAIRPEIDSGFAAELDAWAAEGFPSAAEPAKRGARTPRLAGLRERFRSFSDRPLLPTMTAAAVILLALVTAVGVSNMTPNNGDGDSASSDDHLTPVEGQGVAAESGNAGAINDRGIASRSAPDEPVAPGTTLPPTPPSTEPIKPGQERIQEKTASMTLSADADEVRDVADGVVDVVDRYDGIVVSSNVNVSGDKGRASFDLRIPSQNLQAALSDLSDLASVQARNDGVLDITAPFISAQERFDDAKAEVDGLVAQLADAGSPEETAQIREQLRTARSELATVRSELASLKQRAEFSHVTVTVVGDGDADGWSIGDAIDDAGSVLESIGGALLVALAAIVPLALILGLGWLALTRLRRRNRERALDES